jgi:SAM-dependent methyltransferase
LNLYDESYYRNGYVAFEAQRRARFRALLDRLRGQGAVGPLLDIGAGVGLLVDAAEKKGWTAEGMEPSPDACRLARDLYGVELKQTEIMDVDPQPIFGVVVLWHVLAHTADPREVLRQAAKMLPPAGLLVMSFVNWNDPFYQLGMLLARWKHVNAIHVPAILWRFRGDHLHALAQQAGLHVETVNYEHRACGPSSGWKRNLLELGFEAYRKATRTSEEMEVWCRRIESQSASYCASRPIRSHARAAVANQRPPVAAPR